MGLGCWFQSEDGSWECARAIVLTPLAAGRAEAVARLSVGAESLNKMNSKGAELAAPDLRRQKRSTTHRHHRIEHCLCVHLSSQRPFCRGGKLPLRRQGPTCQKDKGSEN